MQYTSLIKVTALFTFLNVKYLSCHSKDLGEANTNWFNVVVPPIQMLIVGGKPATLEQYPYNVQFYNSERLCGGSILSKKIVLTAAHCFEAKTNVNEMKIFTNATYIFDSNANKYNVWDYLIHERYGEEIPFANDIAIIIIHAEFEFSPRVQKVMITDNELWLNENESFTVTGWGHTKYGGRGSILMEANLHFVDKYTCMARNKLKLSPDMFCLFGEGERDTCQGDSGGGVLWKSQIVGIVSHGMGCGPQPGMYASVFYHNSWIQKSVKNLYKKFCDYGNRRIK